MSLVDWFLVVIFYFLLHLLCCIIVSVADEVLCMFIHVIDEKTNFFLFLQLMHD